MCVSGREAQMQLVDVRERFGREMAHSAGLTEDSAVARVFATTRREDFLGAPPWLIFDGDREALLVSDPVRLYQDVLVQIKAEAAINNGQPSLHALCLAALRITAGEMVVHVGAGTGYYTAMLAQLTGSTGCVEAYEIEDDLAERAAANLKTLPWVSIHSQSGSTGSLPQCDVLYVNAAATDIPDVWLNALRMEGRLLFPLTPDDGYGGMLLVTQHRQGYAARFLCGARFVGCAGARDEAMAKALAGCFNKGNAKSVRSLRRGDTPDESAWCAGRRWWLSTRELERTA
jgi:protein-L-isoaspartate(D-aspartate) O-methyltransferase